MNGKKYTLESTPIDSGGEGDIYNVENMDYLAKIYKSGAINSALEEKLKIMIKNPPNASVLSQVAWPLDLAYNDNGKCCGFIMPKLNINAELNEIYKYPATLPLSMQQKINIAQNICVVISEVHQAGYIFGDFNPRNIGLDIKTGLVSFLDTDTYHVPKPNQNDFYRCNVCAPGYAAPELLERCSDFLAKNPAESRSIFAKTPLPTFTKETDNFALAIHIFKLLMNGYTPFGGIIEAISASQASPGVGDSAVRRNNYCFRPGYKPQAVAIPGLETLPQEIADLFTKAFIEGKINPKLRPNAVEWYEALAKYERELTTCSKNRLHQYDRKNNVCPLCEADRQYNAVVRGVSPDAVSDEKTSQKPIAQKSYVANYEKGEESVTKLVLNTPTTNRKKGIVFALASVVSVLVLTVVIIFALPPNGNGNGSQPTPTPPFEPPSQSPDPSPTPTPTPSPTPPPTPTPSPSPSPTPTPTPSPSPTPTPPTTPTPTPTPTPPPRGAFVPVERITGVSTNVTAGTQLILVGTVNPSNATNRNITWSIVNDTGAGASISQHSSGGVRDFRLNSASVGTVTVRATVINGETETTNFTEYFRITVTQTPTPPPTPRPTPTPTPRPTPSPTPTPPGTPPTITTTSLLGGLIWVDYNQTIAATGGTPITWSVSAGNLPPGLSLEERTGRIVGRPTTAGRYRFTVRAQNARGYVTRQLSIEIFDLYLRDTTLQGTVGEPFTTNITAVATPVSWRIASGSLPSGVSLDSNTGRISGVPLSAGVYTFSVTIYFSDIANSFTTPQITLTITPAQTTGAIMRLAVGAMYFTNRGIIMPLDAAPFIDPAAGRTMVPIRAIAEGLGATVNWNAATQTMTITLDGNVTSFTIGVPLPDDIGVPVEVHGNAFVPMRALIGLLGVEVRWDGENRAVYIY